MDRERSYFYTQLNRKGRLLVIALLMCIACFSMPSDIFAREVKIGMNVQYGQTEARKILSMINKFRSSSDAWYWNEYNSSKVMCKGLPALRYDSRLEKVAMLRAAEIALSYGHTRPNDAPCFTAFSDCGVAYMWAGENIAAGYDTADEVHDAWREDHEYYDGQGHRRIMLSDKYNAVGIGHVYYNGYHYWVEAFGSITGPKTNTGAKNGSTNVTVKIADYKIRGLEVKFDSGLQYMKVGTQTGITSAVLSIDGQWPEMLDRPVSMMPSFTSSNASIAAVRNGKLVGNGEGTASITATLLGRRCSISVNVHDCTKHGEIGSYCTLCGAVVEKKSAAPQIEQEHVTQEQQGQTQNIRNNEEIQVPSKSQATIKLSTTKLKLKKGKSKTIKVSKLTKGDTVKSWKSSNKKVASVNKKGVIKAKNKGKAVITVTLASGKTATVKVIVK